MNLHPLHRVHLGIGGESAAAVGSRELHPLHRVLLGIDPGLAAPRSAGVDAGTKAGTGGFFRAAAGLVAAVVALAASQPVGAK